VPRFPGEGYGVTVSRGGVQCHGFPGRGMVPRFPGEEYLLPRGSFLPNSLLFLVFH